MDEPVFLITGAGGYLGRRLVARAESLGRVISVHRREPSAASSEVAIADVAERDAVLELVERMRPSAIVHAAAVNPGQGDEDTMERVNAGGSRNVAEAAKEIGARLVAV